MKKIFKNFISLALIISMLLSVPAYAQNDNDVINALSLIKATGIQCDISIDAQQITRDDFLTLVMSLIKTTPHHDNSVTFSDVEQGSTLHGYLCPAIQLGIISPSDYFYPEKPITYYEAFKILVVALGYSLEAQQYGGYPNGYALAASKCNLLADIHSYDGNSHLDGLNFFLLLKNFIEAPLRIQTSFGDVYEYTIDENINILSEYFDMREISGIIDANSTTALYESSRISEEMISISGSLYRCGIPHTLGNNVRAYVKETGSYDEIVYLEPVDNKTFSISTEDIISASWDKLTYYDNDKEINVNLKNPIAFIYNGVAYNEYTPSDFKAYQGTLTLTDNNCDNVYDIASLETPEIFFIDKINKDTLTLFDTNTAKSISLADNNLKYELYFNGNAVTFSELTAGSIAYCYYSMDKKVIKLDICSKSVSGKATQYSATDNALYIDDTAYIMTDYFSTIYMPTIELGSYYNFVLTSDNRLGAKYKSDSSMSFAYLIKIGTASNSAFDTGVIVKLFDSKGEFLTYPLAEKVILNGDEGGTKDRASVYSMLRDGTSTKEQLIRFRLNSAGEISAIDTESSSTGYYKQNSDPLNNLVRLSFDGDTSTSENITYKGNRLFMPHFSLSDSTIIFNIVNDPSLSDEYRCSNRISFNNDEKLAGASLKAYNVSEAGTAQVFLYLNNEAVSGNNMPSEPNNGLVCAYKNVLDAEGTACHELEIYSPTGIFEYYYIYDNSLTADFSKGANGEPLQPGDYVRFTANAKSEITAIKKDFDVVQMKVLHSSATYGSILGYAFAKAYAIDETSISYIPISDYFGYTDMSSSRSVLKNAGTVVKFNLKTKTASPATLNDIVTYTQSNDSCSAVLIRSRYAVITNIVIYE